MDVWLDVWCPDCHAKVGEFCREAGTGNKHNPPHARRIRVFEAALKLKQELEK